MRYTTTNVNSLRHRAISNMGLLLALILGVLIPNAAHACPPVTSVTYTLTVIKDGTGTVTPSGGEYDAGTALTLLATGSGGYVFERWGNGSTSRTKSITMNSNKTVYVYFVLGKKLTLTTDGNGTASASPAGENGYYKTGVSVNLSASPNTNYNFDNWTGDASGTNASTSITMDTDKSAMAHFSQQMYTLTMNTSPDGGVSPPEGDHEYAIGTVKAISAFTANGFRFTSWSGAASGTNPSTEVTMNADKSVTANFMPDFALTMSKAGIGGGTPVVQSLTPGEGTTEYGYKQTVSVSAAGADGWVFDHWSGEEIDGSTSASESVFISPGDPHKYVTAHFARYKLTMAKEGDGGTVSPDVGETYVDTGEEIAVTATEDADWRFDHWEGDDIDQSTEATETVHFDAANRERSVTAVFVSQHTLTVVLDYGGGDCTGCSADPAEGEHFYDEDVVVPVTATPASGWGFDHWDGVDNVVDNTGDVTMDGDKTITAFFVEQCVLTVGSNGGGTVADPYVPGQYIENVGAQVTLTPVPDAQHRFVNWSNAGGGNSGSADPWNLTLSGDQTVNANFVRQFELTMSASAGGSVAPSAGVHLYDEVPGNPTVVSLSAYPHSSWRLGSWGGPVENPSGTHGEVTMDADKTFNVVFVEQCQLTVTSAGNGTVAPASPTTYDKGMAVSAQASPDAGYLFDTWSGDYTGSSNPYSFSINANTSVTAHFVPKYELTVTKTGGGSVSPFGGPLSYKQGETVTVTYSTPSGWRFDRWEGAGTTVGNTREVVMTGAQSKTVNCVFVEQWTLTATASPTEGGSVSGVSNPYEDGQTASLSANPTNGWVFDEWTGSLGGANPDSPSLSLSMDRNCGVTAVFVEHWTLTINKVEQGGSGGEGEGEGEGDPGGECSVTPYEGDDTHPDGENVTMTAVPGTGWTFSGWSGDIGGEDPDALSITVTMDADKTVTATFAPICPDGIQIIYKRIVASTTQNADKIISALPRINEEVLNDTDGAEVDDVACCLEYKWESVTTNTDLPDEFYYPYHFGHLYPLTHVHVVSFLYDILGNLLGGLCTPAGNYVIVPAKFGESFPDQGPLWLLTLHEMGHQAGHGHFDRSYFYSGLQQYNIMHTDIAACDDGMHPGIHETQVPWDN